MPDAVSRARRLLPVLPALLLLVVAGAQVTLARRALLSPWKGGGFGMFSTLDARPYRYVRIYVEGRDRSEELRVPPSLEEEASAAEILPTPRNLARLADAIAERERARGRPVETVSVELWRAEYETESLAATARKLLDYTRRAPR